MLFRDRCVYATAVRTRRSRLRRTLSCDLDTQKIVNLLGEFDCRVSRFDLRRPRDTIVLTLKRRYNFQDQTFWSLVSVVLDYE